MNDLRVMLADLTSGADPSTVLSALDSVEVIIEAPEERCQSRTDQAGLFALVNLVGRLHGHVRLELASGLPADLGVFGSGDLAELLRGLLEDIAPAPAAQASETFHLSWGADPSGPGLAVWGGGWSYGLGPSLPFAGPDPGPGVGALAAAAYAASQLMGRQLSRLDFAYLETQGFAANLLNYSRRPAPEVADGCEFAVAPTAFCGGGSVGSSGFYTACLLGLTGGPVDVVDDDEFSERNVLRYPVLRRRESGPKATWLEELAGRSGLEVTGHVMDINGFVNQFDEPPVIDLAVVSVDTVEGRRDATDVLARTTLNVGVGAMQLHISAHGFDRESGCSYCRYVDQGGILTDAAMLAGMLGLSQERLIAAQLRGGRIDQQDAEEMVNNGRFADNPPQAGDRIADLRRRIYAQASVPTPAGEVLVSAPAVSAFAGALICGELVKHASRDLQAHRLTGRCDFDMTGEPTGVVALHSPDQSGNCLCQDPFRLRFYRELRGLQVRRAA